MAHPWSCAMTRRASRRCKLTATPTPSIPTRCWPQGASSPSICTCEFLSWGVWASSARDPRNNGKTLAAFGSYVAGTPTTTVQLPTTGTATYNGSMVGFASDNGHISPASGTYRNVWTFQNGNGVFNGSFDGRSYSGTTTGRAADDSFHRHLQQHQRISSFWQPERRVLLVAVRCCGLSGRHILDREQRVLATRQRASSPVSVDFGRR